MVDVHSWAGVFQQFWTFSEKWDFPVISNLLSNLVNLPVLFPQGNMSIIISADNSCKHLMIKFVASGNPSPQVLVQ